MGKRVVDDTSLTALANKLRDRSTADGTFVFPDGFMTLVDATFDKGHLQGFHRGWQEAEFACTTKHFVHTFSGNGSGSVSFYVPFEPDAIQIIGFHPLANRKSYALAMFTCDCRAFGTLGGLATYGSATGALSTSLQTTSSVLSRYSFAEDGMLTIKDIATSVIFAPEYTYTAVVTKYTEQTDRERITAFVDSLSGSGTVTLNRAKVSAAFSDDEWAALIASKPDWTFTWI